VCSPPIWCSSQLTDLVEQMQRAAYPADLRLPMRLVEEFVDAGRSPDDFTAAFTQRLRETEAGGKGKRSAIANLCSRARELAKEQDGLR